MVDIRKVIFTASFDDATPRVAKGIIARLLRDKGYQIRRAGRGKDRGVDMIVLGGGKRIALILKLHSKRVGAGEIQKAEGARREVNADVAWVFSRKGFTEDGEEAAARIGVRCLDPEALWKLRPVKPAVVELKTA